MKGRDGWGEWKREALKKYSGGLYQDFEFQEVEAEDVLVIDRGVLFLMAFWSGPAAVGFTDLCRVLQDGELPDGFVFRLLDIDGASRRLIEGLSKLPMRIGGNGEAYWFRKGEILAVTSAPTATEARIRELLEEIGRDPED